MNIGSVSSTRVNFSNQSLRINKNSSSDSAEELKKQLTASTKSTNKSQEAAPVGGPPPGRPQGGPPPGRPQGGPPKELSKSDLGQIKNKISESGGQGADKIDELIKNFDQYDNGSGKISSDDFKSYASQNGISLPQPKQRPDFQGFFPQGGENGDNYAGASVIKNSVAGILSKYSSSSSTASASSSSSSTDYSSMSASELQKAAASGDTKAQEELDKRESSGSSNGQGNTAISAGVNIQA